MVQIFFSTHDDVDLRAFDFGAVHKNRKSIPQGIPLFFDDFMRPMIHWNALFRVLALKSSRLTLKSYAYDAKRFIKYCENLNTDADSATAITLTMYMEARAAQKISLRTQAREMTVVRQYYELLFELGFRKTLPWVKVGKSTTAHPKVVNTGLKIRALSHPQWTTFRDTGLGGLDSTGQMDRSFRGDSVLRDTSAAELAITTGMRLQEWRTLLISEIPKISEVRTSETLELEETAKGKRYRTIYVPRATIKRLELYADTERKAQIRRSQLYLTRNLNRLAIVTKISQSGESITYTLTGTEYSLPFRMIPEAHRRVLVVQDEIIEPLSLFLGRNGLPPSQRFWIERFATANKRVAETLNNPSSLPKKVTAHDLRHTFAVVVLQGLYSRALAYEKSKPKLHYGSLTEHLVFNPLLTLQRLMGHASPETTMHYIRYADDTNDVVQKAFETWNDPQLDYSDHIADLIEIANQRKNDCA